MSGSVQPLLLAVASIPTAGIVIACIMGAIGALLLLPSHRSAASRALGGVLLGASLLVIAALALRATSGPPEGAGPFFWIFAAIAIFGAIRVITHPRPVYSALYFVLTVFASAGLFILLSADFIAAALILIYAGAILVTYVFVIMLAAQASTPSGSAPLAGLAEYDVTSREPLVATCVGFALIGVMTFLIFDKGGDLIPPQPLVDSAMGKVVPDSAVTGPTQALGEYLFHHQLINVELAGLILTLSMVGAIVIARRRIETPDAGGATPEEVLGPATPINDDPHSIPVFGTKDPGQKAYPQT